ncbi:MAG: methyltransferase domain-containing protein [Pseudomonadota bacterium]|nr:methyltransferase domain-containing protein [Pseudomonadota bacterium]
MTRSQRCHDNASRLSNALRNWYGTAAGQPLLLSVKDELDRILPRIFGYYALQIGGVSVETDLMECCRTKRRIRLDSVLGGSDVVGSGDALPFQSDSLDLILLLHSLEFSADPHAILREVDRTLIPEGYLVIVGFNPLSLHGLWGMLLRHRGRVPWCGRFYSSSRIRDWLSVLGFDLMSTTSIGFRPPINHLATQQRSAFFDHVAMVLPQAGSAHVHLARKKVATLTPIKLAWPRRRGLLPGNLAEPSTRESAGV